MATAFDRDQLLEAFDEIGRAAIAAQTRLEIAVFGGSALMLASNFRFSTEDVDIAEIGRPWPEWLAAVVERIGARNGWPADWLNEAVAFHLSKLANPARDLVLLGTFPRASEQVGLVVFVPTARYMLALKLKALRVADFDKGSTDLADTAALLRVLAVKDVEAAIGILAEFFPISAVHADKQRFVLKRLLSAKSPADAPRYPRSSL
ncbi:MAG: hypothetical protein ABWY92_24235 [Xanthobacteraceae bacterium]|jgi:hypothetical protein